MKMVNIYKYIIISLIVIQGMTAWGAVDTSTSVFAPDIKTLTVKNPDNFMASPVIRLGTADRLWINFDILEEDNEYLRYRLIHCNSDWQPSRLLESEYIRGFNEAEIDDYGFSSNTFVHYVNYNIEIPNQNMEILVSGNYLLQVYPEDNPDDVLLQARFSVSENSMAVNGKVTSRTDKGYNTEYQQLMLSVNGEGNPMLNPYQDIIVTVTQNNRPETMRTVTHPLRVEGKNIIFEHDPSLIFNGANEYRRFETVRVDYPGMHADSVRYEDGLWHSFLKWDEARFDKEYNYDSTQKGRFLIDEYNADEPDLGADYVMVHFTLDSPMAIGGDIFVDGDFTYHKFDESNKMVFDHNTGLYTLQMPLKQGSYNYQYVVKPRGTGNADPGPVEGNKYETQNEYLVQVYLRLPGARADRLVGSAQFVAGY